MKWIKYNIAQSIIEDEVILACKKVGYSEANLVIARQEAYNGEYTIEEDDIPEPETKEIPTKLSQLENDSKYVTEDDLDDAARWLARKTDIIADATSGAKTLSLASTNVNKEWRFLYASGIESLSFTRGTTFSNTGEFYFSVIFRSAAAATVIRDNVSIHFTGDDCVNGQFIPVSTKWYDVGIWWNGISFQGVVRGV